MSEKLYRESQQREYSMQEFMNAKFAMRRTRKPDCAFTPLMEWYCTSEDCIVREVYVQCKLLGPEDKIPKSMKCPVCYGVLEHHGYVEYDTLLLVKDGETP